MKRMNNLITLINDLLKQIGLDTFTAIKYCIRYQNVKITQACVCTEFKVAEFLFIFIFNKITFSSTFFIIIYKQKYVRIISK